MMESETEKVVGEGCAYEIFSLIRFTYRIKINES